MNVIMESGSKLNLKERPDNISKLIKKFWVSFFYLFKHLDIYLMDSCQRSNTPSNIQDILDTNLTFKTLYNLFGES